MSESKKKKKAKKREPAAKSQDTAHADAAREDVRDVSVDAKNAGDEGENVPSEEPSEPPVSGAFSTIEADVETTVNLTGSAFAIPGRDDRDPVTAKELPDADSDGKIETEPMTLETPATHAARTRAHLKGLLEALIFASDQPMKTNELARAASSRIAEVRPLLEELRDEYRARGLRLDEVAGGWTFRTSAAYAPFVRDMSKQRPVRLTRAQVETLAILAYRQPITRPEIDEIRGVDTGPVLKLLLERDLIRILGKKDEPGRPLLYGTTKEFLEFFGLKSLKDLPTLKEFTELSEDSRAVFEREIGETLSQPMESLAHESQGIFDAAESIGLERSGEDVPADQLPGDERADAAEHEVASPSGDEPDGEKDAPPTFDPDAEAEFPDDPDDAFDDDEDDDDGDDDETEDDKDV